MERVNRHFYLSKRTNSFFIFIKNCIVKCHQLQNCTLTRKRTHFCRRTCLLAVQKLHSSLWQIIWARQKFSELKNISLGFLPDPGASTDPNVYRKFTACSAYTYIRVLTLWHMHSHTAAPISRDCVSSSLFWRVWIFLRDVLFRFRCN